MRRLRSRMALVLTRRGVVLPGVMYLSTTLATLVSMTRVLMPVVLAALAFTLSGCGSDGGGATSEEAAPVEAGAPVAQVGLTKLGAAIEEGWGVECGDELVDMAGYPKIVCPLPDELMSPGMTSNALAVQSFEEAGQEVTFRDAYVPEGEGWVAGDGWFVHAPTQEVADEAAALIADVQ